MKRFTLIGCIVFLVLLLITAAPVTATTTTIAGDSITTVSPSVGLKDNKLMTVTITGVNFTTTRGSVRLEKSGESAIHATDVTSWSPVEIKCTFKFSSSKEAGSWDVVVVKGYDNTEIVKAGAFSITEQMTLTSITPTSAQADNDSVSFTIAGEGLSDVEEVYLYNKNYDNITADDFDVVSDIKIKGKFDLTDTDEGTYDVCVEDSHGVVECDLSFKITTDEVGSIDISSNPSGASIYVDGTVKGTTPDTVDNLLIGSHRIILRKSGYQDWGKMVSVTAGDTTEVDADLDAITTASTTEPTTTIPTTIPRTSKTTVKSTIKVPTTWAYTPTTEASSVDPLIVLGAAGIGLGLVVLRRR